MELSSSNNKKILNLGIECSEGNLSLKKDVEEAIGNRNSYGEEENKSNNVDALWK